MARELDVGPLKCPDLERVGRVQGPDLKTPANRHFALLRLTGHSEASDSTLASLATLAVGMRR
jgi:hypothetical protein